MCAKQKKAHTDDPEKKRKADKVCYDRDKVARAAAARIRVYGDPESHARFNAKARAHYQTHRLRNLKQKSAAYYADVDGKFAKMAKTKSEAYHADVDGKFKAKREAKNLRGRQRTALRKRTDRELNPPSAAATKLRINCQAKRDQARAAIGLAPLADRLV